MRKSQRSKSSKKRVAQGDSPLRMKSASNKRTRRTEHSNNRRVSFANGPDHVTAAMPVRHSEARIPGSPLRPHDSRPELYMGSPRPRGGSPLRVGGSPTRDSPLKDLMTPSRFLGPGAVNVADLSFKYK